jgi:hypothetical protein
VLKTQLMPLKMVQVLPLISWPQISASLFEWSQQLPSFSRKYEEACPAILAPS